LGVTNFTLVELMLEINGEKDYTDFDALMADLRRFEKSIGKVKNEPNTKVKKTKKKQKSVSKSEEIGKTERKTFFQKLVGWIR